MVAPLIAKHTIAKMGFRIDEDGFTCQGRRFKFDQVKELRSVHNVLETKYIGIGSGYTHSMGVGILTTSGEDFVISETPAWIETAKPRVHELIEMYRTLARKTFPARLAGYMRHVQERGCFEYAGWKLYPGERMLVEPSTGRQFPIATTKLRRHGSYIEVVGADAGVGEYGSEALRRFAGVGKGHPFISILKDTDVFFAVLDQAFGLKWPE